MAQELFEPHDMAKMMEDAGSSCRTPGAVNARVRTGYMVPDYRTKRGVSCWTLDGAMREVRSERWRMHMARNLGIPSHDTARLLQRWWPREPVQLVLAS